VTTRLRAALEKSIEKFLADQCEQDDWPDVYWPDTFAERMADAAYAAFRLSVESQQYAEREREAT